jgi:hypothetical protein
MIMKGETAVPVSEMLSGGDHSSSACCAAAWRGPCSQSGVIRIRIRAITAVFIRLMVVI